MAARASRREESRKPPATTEEVAAFLRLEKHTLENWRSAGKGPRWRKIGRGVVYEWPDVYEWYDAQAAGSSPQAGAA